ncbi:MAG: phosphonate ABC transporter ATP-binding protein [Fibrobacteria bacterium]|nr:phosphonate ABC transporter ATP-binding protein [Fibrobacteria bacterium]
METAIHHMPREAPARESNLVLSAKGLVLGYGKRDVVRGIDLEVPRGQFLVVLGPSGSGKTSLLMSLNGSIPVKGGRLEVLEQNPSVLVGRSLEVFRRRIGFIFQSFHLVGRLAVLHNVASGLLPRIPLPMAMLRWYSREQYDRILEALRVVGLEDRVLDRCDRLSGGQKQRIAIARAIVQDPSLILADEPISALDHRSARGVMETLRNAAREFGITVVCNLHHIDTARDYADRIVGLNDGRIVFDGPPSILDETAIAAIYRGSREPEQSPSDPESSAA